MHKQGYSHQVELGHHGFSTVATGFSQKGLVEKRISCISSALLEGT